MEIGFDIYRGFAKKTKPCGTQWPRFIRHALAAEQYAEGLARN